MEWVGRFGALESSCLLDLIQNLHQTVALDVTTQFR